MLATNKGSFEGLYERYVSYPLFETKNVCE